jgi:hypothetical protein
LRNLNGTKTERRQVLQLRQTEIQKTITIDDGGSSKREVYCYCTKRGKMWHRVTIGLQVASDCCTVIPLNILQCFNGGGPSTSVLILADAAERIRFCSSVGSLPTILSKCAWFILLDRPKHVDGLASMILCMVRPFRIVFNVRTIRESHN